MSTEVLLRDVTQADLDVFFTQQLDPEANYMAAFTSSDPANREEFNEHWADILGDDTITKKTILFNRQVAGSILCYPELDKLEVGYWIGKQYWGKGIATQALLALLNEVQTRPLYARAAKDNAASLRVLDKCGFVIIGDDAGFSNARGHRVEEFVLRLEADSPDSSSG
ncbi:MAG: GNAT family N-acetyltransferase [Ktedonobacterales bacterium]